MYKVLFKRGIFFISFSLFSTFSYDFNDIVFIKREDSKNSFIAFITVKNKPYIIKQKKKEKILIFSILKDALAAWIAQDLNISHKVEIIPSLCNIPGKVILNHPAVLLSIAPGYVMTSLEKNKFSQLNIKQFIKDNYKFPGELGFTRRMITQMTLHKQIPIIIGLDLFIGNWGRHRNNFFFDPEKNSFCVIDMDHAFEQEIASLACINLSEMIRTKESFTKKEYKALIILRRTLAYLLKKYPASRIKKQLYIFLEEINFRDSDSINMMKVMDYIVKMEQVIDNNEINTKKVVQFLDKLIERF